ncbi:ATP-dependent DNA helicase [Bacillus sp. BRMEA1]|uniref:ATP-dependent DNA helicase n=1 Tax=Neobacillus endophyticus TaxID=2738405 RepID=UPI001564225E|nr:ATP-dependent DNA helicase [Neobacillus endophyticus]NRD79632.1 ATP-dependent DNA helicase [Neobacillus endophyticus]
MSNEMKISVRNLVEYVFRSGSIDSRFRPQNSLNDGTKAHQKIQKTYHEGDQKEVYLKAEIQFKEIMFIIDGRCDGLLFRDGETVIDEIKSFSHPLEFVEKDGHPVHWAQAKMYAYLVASDQRLEKISVQLTYVQLETEEKRMMKKTFHFKQLEVFAFEVLEQYTPYAMLLLEHQKKRNESSKELVFPFPSYRKGQRKLAGAVYKSFAEEKNLFMKAPTGIGKTISTLFPAVKAMGEGIINRVFYLTSKTITRTTAEEAFSQMRSWGLCLNSLTITAKEKVCFKEETVCQKEYCEYANGYYDRINEAIIDILKNEKGITREIIETYARKHRVCPFEYSIDLAYMSDAVICDYNYVFDPRVSLKRILEEQKKSSALLIDEAHNLVDRGREMFSASLNKKMFLQVKKEFKGLNKTIYNSANHINSQFNALKKKLGEKREDTLEQLDDIWIEILEQFSLNAESLLKNVHHLHLLEAFYAVQNFLKIAELLDEHYVIYVENNPNNVLLKLFCMHPAKQLKQMGRGYRSKVFFSATLSPMPYYFDILGGEAEDFQFSIPSPFEARQTDVFIKPLSTRFHDRNQTVDSIVTMIQSLLESRPGNYLIFFPSYQYLVMVFEAFKKRDQQTTTIVQESAMTEVKREAFLAAFQPNQKGNLLGFAVLGGIFSEGVDLQGERLNGVVVVGVGLPQVCFERNLMKAHFEEMGRNGFDYAYIYPGMNKVLQAGGRLIRSETDFGTIVLVDDRFLHAKYHSLLPDEWKNYTIL